MTNPSLQHLSPILWTKDLQGTRAFYEGVLGFMGKSNFPNFMSFTRGDVEIMFIVPRDDDGDDLQFPEPTLTGSLFIVTTEVDNLWASVKDKAVVKSPICDREYLMRDFSILDNNGYEIVFGEDITNQIRSDLCV
jgi:catechol 2,3-dioxygenase-like lactoylglutathione lyase family enzyme